MDVETLSIVRIELKSSQFDFLEGSDPRANGKFSLGYSEITNLLKESCVFIQKMAFPRFLENPGLVEDRKTMSNLRLFYKYSIVSHEAKI